MVWVPERASWHIEGLSWDRFIKVIHYDFEMLLYRDESYGALDTSLAGQEGSSKQKSSGGIDERASSFIVLGVPFIKVDFEDLSQSDAFQILMILYVPF